jgi:hypothetical protein
MADSDRDITIRVKGKDDTGSVFDKLHEKLEKLKRVAGGRSDVKEITETLAGAGAVAGIAVAAEKLGEMTKAAGEFALSFSEIGPETDKVRTGIQAFVPFGGTILNIGDGFRDIVAGIGRANGASDAFVKKWESVPSILKEAKAAIDFVNNAKAEADAAGAAGGGFQQRANDATYKGKEQIDLNQSSREAQDAQVIAGLRRKLDQDLTITPELREAQARNINQAEAAMERAHRAERKKENEDDSHDRQQQAMDDQTKIEAARAQARQLGLVAQGKDLEASLGQIRTNADAQIEQVKRVTAEQERKNPERTNEIDERALKQIDAINEVAKAQDDAAKRKDANDQKSREFDATNIRAKGHIDELQIEASLGSQSKQIELEKAEIAEKYAEQRESINKRLREDLALTAAQKSALNDTLAGLDAQEKKEEAIAAAKRVEISLASTETSRGITGVAGQFATTIADFKSRLMDATGATGQTSPGITGVAGAVTGDSAPVAAAPSAQPTINRADIEQQIAQAKPGWSSDGTLAGKEKALQQWVADYAKPSAQSAPPLGQSLFGPDPFAKGPVAPVPVLSQEDRATADFLRGYSPPPPAEDPTVAFLRGFNGGASPATPAAPVAPPVLADNATKQTTIQQKTLDTMEAILALLQNPPTNGGSIFPPS